MGTGLHRRSAGPLPKIKRRLRCCPNCGTDLVALEPRHVGDLYLDPMGDVRWKGRIVPLNPTLRLILDTIVTGDGQVSRAVRDPGYFMPAVTIAERAGVSVASLKVLVSNLRGAFRAIDPEWGDHVEVENTNRAGAGGYRWSDRQLPQIVAHAAKAGLTLYDNDECVWHGRYQVPLSPDEARGLAFLIKAQGRWVKREELRALTTQTNETAGNRLVERIRVKFRGVEPGRAGPIESKQGQGYRVPA